MNYNGDLIQYSLDGRLISNYPQVTNSKTMLQSVAVFEENLFICDNLGFLKKFLISSGDLIRNYGKVHFNDHNIRSICCGKDSIFMLEDTIRGNAEHQYLRFGRLNQWNYSLRKFSKIYWENNQDQYDNVICHGDNMFVTFLNGNKTNTYSLENE